MGRDRDTTDQPQKMMVFKGHDQKWLKSLDNRWATAKGQNATTSWPKRITKFPLFSTLV